MSSLMPPWYVPPAPPWYAFIMPWEVPSAWRIRTFAKWRRRHRRIAALEYELGLAERSHRLDASANLGYRLCGEVDHGW